MSESHQQSSARGYKSQLCILFFTLCSKIANAQENFVNDVIDVAVDSKNDLKHSEGNIVLKQEQLLAVRVVEWKGGADHSSNWFWKEHGLYCFQLRKMRVARANWT